MRLGKRERSREGIFKEEVGEISSLIYEKNFI